jgi:hypothetical protein
MDADFLGSVASTRKAFSADVVVTPKNGDEWAVPMAEPLRAILNWGETEQPDSSRS